MTTNRIGQEPYKNHLGVRHQLIRLLWNMVWPLCTFFLPRSSGAAWKRLLLRAFGAHVHPTSVVYSSARIYYPANLTMDAYTCLDSRVNCYNVAPVCLKEHATVSQGAFLCTASHNIHSAAHELVTAPITIESNAWVAAEAFVGMGVVIHEGAVVGARSVVTHDVAPWTIVAGNPVKELGERHFSN